MFYAFCWRDEHPEQNRMQISQQTQVQIHFAIVRVIQIIAIKDMNMDDSDDEEGRMEVTAA